MRRNTLYICMCMLSYLAKSIKELIAEMIVINARRLSENNLLIYHKNMQVICMKYYAVDAHEKGIAIDCCIDAY